MKKARMEQDTADAFKPVGSLTFRINDFREFSNSPHGKLRHCDAKVSVRGLTFGLTVFPFRGVYEKESTQKFMRMGIMVNCENTGGCNVEGDGSWSCLASLTFQIKGSPKSVPIGFFTHRFFSSKDKSSLKWYNSKRSFCIDYFLDPKNGLYNEKEDTVELIMEISTDAPAGIMQLPRNEAIQVNEETVFINKNQLAMHSRYFHSLFYNGQFYEGQSGEYKVTIEAPATVEHFKRMMATMYPENKPLDDQCIEGVLHLANQFLVNIVEGKCLQFLTEKSTKSALTKYRMANKFGYPVLMNYVLDNLKDTDFEKKMFMANMAECNQLSSSAAEALKTCYGELFPDE